MIDNLPLAIIAGAPLGRHQRFPKPTRSGWKIIVIPGRQTGSADLRGVWVRVMHDVDNAPDAGVHLLLMHDHESERGNFAELESKSYRATWLASELSNQYGTQHFDHAVNLVLRFEESWRARLRPAINSPLLLPETAFSAVPSVRDTWTRARRVNDKSDSIDAVANAIRRFRQEHYNQGCWHDNRDLVFSRGPLHGFHGLPEWRQRKLTRHLPPGFHFDVRHSRSRAFRIIDHAGDVSQFSEYTNVDPHGYVRGG